MRTVALSHGPVVQIAADCGPAAAPDVLAALRDRAATADADAPLRLDLTEGPPTALAVQLLAAAARSLRRRNAFGGFGAAAAAALNLDPIEGDLDVEDHPIRG